MSTCLKCGMVEGHRGGCAVLIAEAEKYYTMTREELVAECNYFFDQYDPMVTIDAEGNVVHDQYYDFRQRIRRFLGALARHLA